MTRDPVTIPVQRLVSVQRLQAGGSSVDRGTGQRDVADLECRVDHQRVSQIGRLAPFDHHVSEPGCAELLRAIARAEVDVTPHRVALRWVLSSRYHQILQCKGSGCRIPEEVPTAVPQWPPLGPDKAGGSLLLTEHVDSAHDRSELTGRRKHTGDLDDLVTAHGYGLLAETADLVRVGIGAGVVVDGQLVVRAIATDHHVGLRGAPRPEPGLGLHDVESA